MGESGERGRVGMLAGLKVESSHPRGVSQVWQTQGLERCVFGSVAIVRLTDEFSDVWQLKKLGEKGKRVDRLAS